MSWRLLMLVLAVLCLAGCHLLFKYEGNPDAAPIPDLGRDKGGPGKDRGPDKDKGSPRKDKALKQDTAIKNDIGSTSDKAKSLDKGPTTPSTWKHLTLKGASWASTVSPKIWGRSASEIYLGAGFNLYQCSDLGGTSLNCVIKVNSVGIIQDVGGYTGEVYAVGSGGMVLAKGNKWKSIFTSLTYHFTSVWCDGSGDCFLTGLGGSPPSSGATLINFKGTGVKNTQSFPSVKQLNAVGGAGGSVAAVGSDCSFKLKQGTGSWGTIQVQGMCSQQLKGVWGANANYFFAVGSGGVLVRWTTGTKAYVTGTGGQDLNAVWGAGSKAVWAVGQQGRVVFHDGSGWKDRAGGIKGKPDLSDVWGVGASHVYAVGPTNVVVRFK